MRASRYPKTTCKKAEVAGERKRGRADHGQRAGFRRDDGQADGPPRGGVAAQKVVFESALRFPEARAEPGDRNEINARSRRGRQNAWGKADDSTAAEFGETPG